MMMSLRTHVARQVGRPYSTSIAQIHSVDLLEGRIPAWIARCWSPKRLMVLFWQAW
jgi:hypothetical protein